MRLLIATLVAWMTFAGTVSAQYVTINDANFASWLQQNYPQCMLGNQMDTTCSAITSAQNVDVSGKGIVALWGIQYFDQLKVLNCRDNDLLFWPPVKCCVQEVDAADNDILSVNSFPISLRKVDLSRNPITSLPPLPNFFRELRLDSVFLSSVPTLPSTLTTLQYSRSNLTSVPPLPAGLSSLVIYGNPVGSLPSLPPNLIFLDASGCNLTSLPPIPGGVFSLQVAANQLTSLPALPQNLVNLNVTSNQLTCLPELPLGLISLGASANPLTCVPNYLPVMSSALLALPLCQPNDPVNNPNGCVSVEGIVGYAFEDVNSDCVFGFGDIGASNIPLLVFDNSNNQIGSVSSASNGVFQYPAGAGTYRLELDVANAPITFNCVQPGLDSTVVVPAASPFVQDVNFEVGCPTGFDVGAMSAAPVGWVFPGQDHELRIRAGDLSNFYNLNCAAGVIGTVTVNVSGPVSYVGPSPGSVVPTASGLSFTYPAMDFDTVDASQDFRLLFNTDTTAQSGDTICVDVTVTPSAGDNNPTNNTLSLCYDVVNSYDPNDKLVYPAEVEPGFANWIYYTVRFQNTGTAPAFNIRIADTLSADLDWDSFQLLEASHSVQTSLAQGVLNFKFADIMLPDSLSDPAGSQGYVQFRFKPEAGLPDGTVIGNRAAIYFDFNAPIITNTATTLFGEPVGTVDPIALGWLRAFPNPTSGDLTVVWEGPSARGNTSLEIWNALGQRVQAPRTFGTEAVVDLTGQPGGIYFLRLHNSYGTYSLRVLKK